MNFRRSVLGVDKTGFFDCFCMANGLITIKIIDRLDKIKSKRKKKKYTKILEKFLQEELTAELRKLTRKLF